MHVFTNTEKQFVGTTALIVFCILFFAFFEESAKLSSVLQGFIISFIFFFCLPITYTRFVLGQPLASLGFRSAEHIKALLWSLFSAMAGFLGSWVLLYQYPEIAFQATFPLLVEASFVWFVVYTLTLLPLTLIIYEVFFRGMVQILWLGNTWKAVAIQGVLFGALIYLTAGLTWIDAPLIIAAFAAGFVAKKTGSLWYAFLTSYLSIFLTDVLFLSLR